MRNRIAFFVMNRFVALLVTLPSAAFAEGAFSPYAAYPAPPPPPETAPSLSSSPTSAAAPLRRDGLGLSPTQALLWDAATGQYSLRSVGDDINGARLIAVDGDRLILQRASAIEPIDLVLPPALRIRRAKRTVVADAPYAAAPVATAPAPVLVAPAPVAVPPAPVVVAPAPVAVPPAPVPPAPAPVVVAPAPVAAPPAPAPVTASASAPAPASDGETALLVGRAELAEQLARPDQLGATAIPFPGGGYRVTSLRPGSFLESLGLRPGDVVQRIDGRPINSPEDATRACAWLRLADHFTVDVLRDGAPVELRFQVGG